MEILRCRTCGARQPRDWAPGDLCVACGAAARPELRCPACVAWSPEGRFCRECGCELPSRDRYGVARMLAAAGVDRFSLGARLRELDPGQAETLAAQYATQWAIASRRLDEAALCEGFLRTRGHTVGLEEALARELPFPPARRRELEGGPPGPFEGRDDLLPAVLAQSPLELNRSLAALALLRRDRVSDAAVERARAALHGQALATEAALALAAWPVRGEARLDRRELARVDEVARAALPVPSLAAAAAVACAWAERAEPLPEELAGPLREGLTGKDAVLRFDCALALGDEAALGAALDSEDERVRRLARRRLGALGSVVLVPSLAGGDEAARRDAAAGLQPPLSDRLVGAWLGGARGDAAKREALAFVRRARFEAYTPAARGEIAAWARREAVALGAEEILETLSWAAGDDRGGDAAALGNEGPAWLAAAHEALRALPVAALPERLRGTAFGRYLALDPGGALPLLLGWIGQAPALDAALRALLRQHAALQRERPDTRMSSLLLQLWDRAERDRPVLAASLARVLAGERGMAGRASVLEGFWQRFRERPSERRDVLAALAPWKQQLFELRDAEPPEGSLHGGDARRFFEIYYEGDPGSLLDTVDAALERAPPEQLDALAAIALAACEAEIPRQPRSAMVAAFHVAAHVVNLYREKGAPEALRPAVERVRAAGPLLERKVREAKVEDDREAGGERFCDDYAVELRLAAEAEERARPAVKPTATPTAAPTPTPTATPAPTPTATPTGPAPATLVANVSLQPLDVEPLASGQPLPSLADYVAVLKTISAGANVSALFAARGLDASKWAANVEVWNALLGARPDLALRFAALLQAEWKAA